MIDINLVRNRIEPLPEGVERLSGLVVAVLIFSYLFTGVLIYGWRYHLQQSARPLENKYEELRQFHQESDQYCSIDFWKTYREHVNLLEKCRDYARAKQDCGVILMDIARACPRNVVVTSINLGSSYLEIHGRTRSANQSGLEEIERFVLNLHGSEQPLLKEAEQDRYSGGTGQPGSRGYDFVIKARR
jgi:Tfp pilus assembly protein PilN